MTPPTLDRTANQAAREAATDDLLGILLSGPSILDPTLTIEHDRLGLRKDASKLYMPRRWVSIVESGDWHAVRDVLRALRWYPLFQRVPEIERYQQLAMKDWIHTIDRSYQCSPSDRDRLIALNPTGWKLRRPVDGILADIYSFLRGAGRSVVTKTRRPFFALRDRGVSILEFGGDLLRGKRRFFRSHPNAKFYIGTLIPLQMLLNEGDPATRLLGIIAQETIAFVDPERAGAPGPNF